jgi:hypothetical protein
VTGVQRERLARRLGRLAATWQLHLPFDSGRIGGAAYDAHHGVIYVSQQNAEGPAPVIHALEVRR